MLVSQGIRSSGTTQQGTLQRSPNGQSLCWPGVEQVPSVQMMGKPVVVVGGGSQMLALQR